MTNTDTFGNTIVKAKDAVAFLNDAFESDPKAMAALVDARVPCNDRMASHPTIQVQENEDKTCSVGLLGILNGLFGINHDGRGHIEAVYDGVYPTLTGFRPLTGFRLGPAEDAPDA